MNWRVTLLIRLRFGREGCGSGFYICTIAIMGSWNSVFSRCTDSGISACNPLISILSQVTQNLGITLIKITTYIQELGKYTKQRCVVIYQFT